MTEEIGIRELKTRASAIARGQGHSELGIEFALQVAQFPNLTLVPVDRSLAALAVEVAARHRLHGSDAVYAAVSLRFDTQLVTLDREHRARLGKVVRVSKP